MRAGGGGVGRGSGGSELDGWARGTAGAQLAASCGLTPATHHITCCAESTWWGLQQLLSGGWREPEVIASSAVKSLSKEDAQAVDQEVFNEYQFGADQLKERVRLSFAIAIAKAYPRHSCPEAPCCLVIYGDGGTNGGDGQACASNSVATSQPSITLKGLTSHYSLHW